MKLFCFLIPCVFVKVSTYNIVDYLKDIIITNTHIEMAHNFPIKDNFISNGLEYVIKQIVVKNQYSLEVMSSMIAIPETRGLRSWKECQETQKAFQDEIQRELNIAVPQVPEENFRGLNLRELGNSRRVLTGKALKNILNQTRKHGDPENVANLIEEKRILRTEQLKHEDSGNVTNLIEARRLPGKHALEKRITRALAGPEEEISLLCMCHFIALFTNTKFPVPFVNFIQIDPSNGTCTLNDGFQNTTYREIKGKWCQVDLVDLDKIVQSLNELLQ